MRTIFTLLIFCFGFFQIQAQISTLHVNQGCSYDDVLTENDLYLYDPSNEAERIVAEIVDALGLTKNFTVRSSNVSNALATTHNGVRFIFYSTSFLEKFKADANTQWAAYSVLAHEIGHHLNGHNFGETNPRTRKMLELEADQFSGSVLRMLGASIEEGQAGLNTFDLQGETNTHPPTTARKEAVSNGWKKRDEWLRDRGMTVQRKVNTTEASKKIINTPNFESGTSTAKQKEIASKMINEPAAAFSLSNLEGKTVSLESLKGKIVVIDFWATWCGPCKRTFPGMQLVVDKYKNDKEVAFVFINSWEKNADKAKNAYDFIAGKGYTFNVLLDTEDKIISSFKVGGIPTKYVLDRNGKIRFKTVGFEGTTESMVEELSLMIEAARSQR